jgi:hypothetical protein
VENWLSTASSAAGLDDVDGSLLGDDATTLLLDLAREAAHNVARPAAPLATFVAGLALGRSGGDIAELRAVIGRIVDAAQAAAKPDDGA